jgi:hypothetical protein
MRQVARGPICGSSRPHEQPSSGTDAEVDWTPLTLALTKLAAAIAVLMVTAPTSMAADVRHR